MSRRTTIDVDEELLERAREVLGETTPSGTVEEALRRVASQRRYLQQLAERVDVSVLASDAMWGARRRASRA